MERVAYWGRGLPEQNDLPASPGICLSEPAIRPALARVASWAPRLLGRRAALRQLTVTELARWLALRPSFAFHEVEQTLTWSGVRVRPLDRSSERFLGPQGAVTGLVIAQNEEDRIGDALSSLGGLVDDIVVVDGGSTDDTVAVAAAAGARVLRRPFDRFDAQRNAGMALVRTPWTIYLDCDERVRASAIPLIRAATASTCDAVALNTRCLVGDEPTSTVWPGDGPRMFRSHLRFNGSLHESLPLRSVLRMPLAVDFVVTWKSASNALANDIRYRRMADPGDPGLAVMEGELARLPRADRAIPSELWS